MTRTRPLTTTRSAFALPSLALVAALALASAGWSFAARPAPAAQPPIPRGVSLASWHDNGRDGRYVLQLVKGKPLAAKTKVAGTVLSDTNCDADSQGLNHCHNLIELPDGTLILVINTHEMHRNRCLGAGDKLALDVLDSTWLVGTLGRS